jgi:hypothetical protein
MSPAYLEVAIVSVIGNMCLFIGLGLRHKNAISPVPDRSTRSKALIAIVIGLTCIVAAAILAAKRFVF